MQSVIAPLHPYTESFVTIWILKIWYNMNIIIYSFAKFSKARVFLRTPIFLYPLLQQGVNHSFPYSRKGFLILHKLDLVFLRHFAMLQKMLWRLLRNRLQVKRNYKQFKRTESMYYYLNTLLIPNPVTIYLFKIKNRNTRKKCEICSKSTTKTPERRWCFYC